MNKKEQLERFTPVDCLFQSHQTERIRQVLIQLADEATKALEQRLTVFASSIPRPNREDWK